MKIWENVSNIIKKINSELIYNKLKRNSTQKNAFKVFIY